MSKGNDVLRHLQIVAAGEEPGGDLTFDGATGKLSVMRVCPLVTAGNTRITDRKQDLQTLLECSICLETFEEPHTLPCLHSFCKKCLENFVDGKCDDELNCPVCRSKFTLNKKEGVAGMTRNHFICNMIEVLSFQHQDKCIPCSHCSDQFHPLREAKPQEKGVTEPRMDDESLGRGHQQRAERKHEGKGDQTQRRDNNENQSANTGSTPPRDVGSQSPPTSPLTSQMNTPQHPGTTQSWGLGAQRSVPPTTSAPTSFRQVYDASLHYGTAQGQGRGIPGNGPMLTNPPTSQPFSPHPGTGPLFDTAQGGHYGTQGNFPQPTYSPRSQNPQTRGRETQRNISPYSSSQNPQHPHYAQQGSQRSAKDRDRSQRNMQSQQSYASPYSSQALAKHRGSALPIGSTTATGHF